MRSLSFHGDDVVPSSLDTALFHILPVPLEETVSYGGGTADGPRAILEASRQLELFDGRSVPADCGIYTAEAMDCSGTIDESLERLARRVSGVAARRAVPVTLGGEHSLTAACVSAIKEHHRDFGVIQFDAHADLRHAYEGSKNSHASVMRRIWEMDLPIYQIGTRSYCLEEHHLRQKEEIAHVNAEIIWRQGTAAAVLPGDFPEKVYITFDADCFDVSLMAATGTPVPGGLLWHQVMALLENIFCDRICLGFDLVELAPQPGMHGATFTMAQLAYVIMGYLVRSDINRDFYDITASPG